MSQNEVFAHKLFSGLCVSVFPYIHSESWHLQHSNNIGVLKNKMTNVSVIFAEVITDSYILA